MREKTDDFSDGRYFFSIILPLSSAIIAVSALFTAVGHWNAYFDAMLSLNTRSKVSLQRMTDIMKYSLLVISSAPIMMFYPFAHKFFVKGVMIGSLKG